MKNSFGWSLLAVVCACSIVAAQVRTEPRATDRPRAGAAPAAGAPGAVAQPNRAQPGQPAAGQQGTADQQIAAFIYGCARNEVELSKFAQERAKSDDVREFAAMMVKEHQPQAQKMAKLAGNLVNVAATETRTETRRVDPDANDEKEESDDASEDETREGAKEGSRREARDERREARGGEARGDEATTTRTTTTAAAGGRGGLNWTSIHTQIANQCLRSTQQELGRYKGDDFDKAYMGQQVVAHMKTIDELKVLRSHASGQLQQEIESGIETAEHHLQEARKIMDEQKDQGSKGTSGREESRPSEKPGEKRKARETRSEDSPE